MVKTQILFLYFFFFFMGFHAGINENDAYNLIYAQYKLEAEKNLKLTSQ